MRLGPLCREDDLPILHLEEIGARVERPRDVTLRRIDSAPSPSVVSSSDVTVRGEWEW